MVRGVQRPSDYTSARASIRLLRLAQVRNHVGLDEIVSNVESRFGPEVSRAVKDALSLADDQSVVLWLIARESLPGYRELATNSFRQWAMAYEAASSLKSSTAQGDHDNEISGESESKGLIDSLVEEEDDDLVSEAYTRSLYVQFLRSGQAKISYPDFCSELGWLKSMLAMSYEKWEPFHSLRDILTRLADASCDATTTRGPDSTIAQWLCDNVHFWCSSREAFNGLWRESCPKVEGTVWRYPTGHHSAIYVISDLCLHSLGFKVRFKDRLEASEWFNNWEGI